MSEPDNFLSRWSRKKLEAEQPEKTAADAPEKIDAEEKPVAAKKEEKAPEPVFDLSKLPSIDSIGADTDIRGFLQPGVPPELTRAALRRAWSADPAIRDFKGLQENDWDFNDPNAMFGFGELDPKLDVKKLVEDLFGGTPKEELPQTATAPDSAERQMAQPMEESGEREMEKSRGADDETARRTEKITPPLSRLADASAGRAQREEFAATQNEQPTADPAPMKRPRSRGGALPQ